MKTENFRSQLSTCLKTHMKFRSTRGLDQKEFQTVLRTVGETETTQEYIQD
jgi:hypothetical protein